MRCRKRTATTGTFGGKIFRWTRRTTRISTPVSRRARSRRPARRRSRLQYRPPPHRISTVTAAPTARICSLRLSTNTMQTCGSFRLTSSGSSGRRTPLALAPLQLLAQQLEVAALACLDQTQHLLRLADVDDVSRLNRIAVLSVVGHEDLVAAARRFGMHLHVGIARNHHGTVSER